MKTQCEILNSNSSASESVTPDVNSHLAQMHVIFSRKECELGDGAGYWSNEDGWTGFDSATKFTAAEMGSFDLPISSGQDAKWMFESEAEANFVESELDRAGIDTLSPAIDHLVRERS